MTNTTPTELQARMDKLVRAMDQKFEFEGADPDTAYFFREASEIVAELPKPINPDVLAVREILADAYGKRSYSTGDHDYDADFQRALAAYRRIKADRA